MAKSYFNHKHYHKTNHKHKHKHNQLFLLEIEIKMVKKMGLEFKNGKMGANIKEILYKMKQLDGVYFIMLMEIYIKDNFQKI
jgi:hypothetical protein